MPTKDPELIEPAARAIQTALLEQVTAVIPDTEIPVTDALRTAAFHAIEVFEKYLETKGLVIVPREPTDEMLEIGWGPEHQRANIWANDMKYKAMVDAAPKTIGVEPETTCGLEGLTAVEFDKHRLLLMLSRGEPLTPSEAQYLGPWVAAVRDQIFTQYGEPKS